VLHRIFALAVRRELLPANAVARTEAPKSDAHDRQFSRPISLRSCSLRPAIGRC
jgi:hypothetical protein